MTEDKHLKLECVRLARDLATDNTIVEDAREIYKFIIEEENNND